jgi:hypothetical protein
MLFRLSTSRHAEAFVLKGAMLVGTWTNIPHRATRDVDFLGLGDPNPARLVELFSEVLQRDGGDDATTFDPDSVRAEEIRGQDRYGGVRLLAKGEFGGAVIHVQMDIGFGDAVEPAAEWIDYPTLVELPAPRIRAYSIYTVVSEKLEAIVALGMQNSRMKDFYDIWTLSRDFEFDGVVLAQAVAATFQRRRTNIPTGTPDALGDEFVRDPDKLRQWKAFVDRGELRDASVAMDQIVRAVEEFAMPCFKACSGKHTRPMKWPPAGPWR